MLVEELLQRIQSLYSRGVQSDDSRLMPQQIWNKAVGARSTIIVQKLNKKQPLSQWTYQTISCMELVPATSYDCPCIPPQGCTILRSKFPLPEPIIGLNGIAVQTVSSLDGTLIFDETSFSFDKYNKGNKYTSKKPRYFPYNNYLFITIVKQIKVVSVSLLANNPLQVWDYPSFCDDPECEDCCPDIYQREFPLDNDNTETVIKMAADELIGIFTQMRQDKNNDASDDTSVQNIVHQSNQG